MPAKIQRVPGGGPPERVLDLVAEAGKLHPHDRRVGIERRQRRAQPPVLTLTAGTAAGARQVSCSGANLAMTCASVIASVLLANS